MNYKIKGFCTAIVCLLSGHALAATTWTLTGTPTAGVSVAGYANTGNVTGTATANDANNGAIQTIQAATLGSYTGGIGITNADACTSGSTCDVSEGIDPEHAIDNDDRYDMALLSFTNSVKLTDVKLGYASNDSDLTVMAYTGAGAFALNTNLVGRTYSQLITSGWTAIGNYSNVGTTTAKAVNAAGVFSSYWLIGAYNPLANSGGGVTDTNFDYVKLLAVTGTTSTPTTPSAIAEPNSLALLALALIAMFAVYKRRPNSRNFA